MERTVLGSILSLAAVLSLSGASYAVPAAAQGIQCASSDGQMHNLLGYLQMLASTTKPDLIRARESISIPFAEVGSIVPVSRDSLCLKAGVLLNRDLHLPDSTSRIVYLVWVKDRYWAEEKAEPKEHYIVGLVIDSTLTTVLAHPGR